MTTQPAPFLDGKHVVFGRIIGQDSMLVLRKIENVATGSFLFHSHFPRSTILVVCMWRRDTDVVFHMRHANRTE